MKPSTGFSAVLVPLLCAGFALAAPVKKTVTYLSADEQEILAELNLARSKPREYAKFLEAHRRQFRGDKTFEYEKGAIMQRQEGIAAVDEAIAFLKKVKPMGILEPSEGLTRAARDHAEDTGPKGTTSHDGSDGSKSSDRMNRYGKWLKSCAENIAFGPRNARFTVTQLIIDDGVPGRGHRKNIFDSRFRTVGIAIGTHKVYGHMCVIDFAGGYQESRSRLKKSRK